MCVGIKGKTCVLALLSESAVVLCSQKAFLGEVIGGPALPNWHSRLAQQHYHRRIDTQLPGLTTRRNNTASTLTRKEALLSSLTRKLDKEK